MTRYRKLRIFAFWATLLFTYIAAILPGDEAPTLGSTDKVNHVMAFLTLSGLVVLAYPRRPAWFAGIALSLFGAFIEVSQAVPFIHRDADVMDWIADTGAVIVGLAITYGLARLAPKLFVD